MLISRRTRVISLLASLLAHAMVVVLLAIGGRGDDQDSAIITPLDMQQEEDMVDLGIERSNAVTMTWIGFEIPDLQDAPESVVDQASFSMASSAGAAADPANPPAPEQAVEAPSPTGDWSLLTPRVPMPVDAQQLRDLLKQVIEAVAANEQVADAGGETPNTGESGDTQETAQETSDRESDAASRRRPIDVSNWNKPVAAEGLEIKTRRPQWTTLMLATIRPQNPKLDITFGADGKVRLIRFVEENGVRQTTGSKDADDVLLNAMYAWTATGKAIDDLDKSNPDAGVTITLRIIMR